jgi:RND family efflux transporter MFP subunit
MFRKYILPSLAVGLMVFAVVHALYIQQPGPQSPPPVPPPATPFGDTVAGQGIVEPYSEASTTGNIAIGSQLAGVVAKVQVHIGETVKKGDLLFELDKRLTEADLKLREAALPLNDAQANVAKANLNQMEDQFKRARAILGTGAIAEQDFVTAQQNYMSATAQLSLAKAAIEQTRAQINQDKTTLDVMEIRAPVNGTILQVNVRPGEYITTAQGQTLILMGNLQPLCVRVNIDQEDLPRLKLNAPARAKIRGDVTQEEIPMTFVRLEPYVVPKTSLTGANTERVDTRVVQVVYAIDSEHHLVGEKKILVGQLLDVFIDTRAN